MAGTDIGELESRLKATWMSGNYCLFSPSTRKGAEAFFERLGVRPGMRLLDVGCGTGRLALSAAHAGAEVTGSSFASLDANGQANMRNALVRLWSAHNRAAGDSIQVDAEYLEIIATRG